MDAETQAFERMRAGDATGLNELIALCKERVFGLAWRYLNNTHEAADVTEETFVKAYFQAHRFKCGRKVMPWLYAITANLCRDVLRQRKRRPGFLSLQAESGEGQSALESTLPANEPHAREQAESSEALQAIEAAIQELPHKLRFPFVFCVLEAHSYDDCAEVLRVSRKTVETRIYRARQQLQAAFPMRK